MAAARLGGGHAEFHRAGAVGRDFDGEVRVDLGELALRILDAIRFPDREGDRIAFDIEAGITDMGVTQRIADAVDRRIEPLTLSRRNIDLEQQIGAAAQIKTERHLLSRVTGQIGELRRGQQVQRAEQQAEQAHPTDQQNLPIGEIQHA